MPQNDEGLIEGADDVPSEETPDTPDGWQRVIRCPITGRRVVASRPGQRKVTSEEVYALLGERVDDDQPAQEIPATPEGWQREVRCPITGFWVVAARPGQRKITSEEVYTLLGEGDEFP